MTAWLDTFQFLRPAWLLALLAIPAFVPWWRARRRRDSVWHDAVDPHLLPHLLDEGRGRRGGGPWPALLAYALAICALAGPSWRLAPQPLLQGEAPLVVAIELASSSLANDLPPSRLLQARSKIDRLLRARAGGQTGLLAYADDAFTVVPLTDDAANVALFLDSLSPDVMPVDGSRPERAIDAASALLRQAGFERGDILLLAGSGSPTAAAAAARARASGHRVSVLGMGTAAGAAYRRGDGGIARAALDAAALRAIAQAGGGGYSAWSPGVDDLASVGVLAATPTPASAAGTTLVPRDDGYWLLLPVLLLAVLAFRRGSPFALALACLWLPLAPAHAQAPRGDAWQRADQAAHARSVEAEAAYRRGDFEAAARAWAALGDADADYNRGNALARSGRYEDALSAYDEALGADPGMEDAVANRAAVAAAMARTPPPGPRDGSRGTQDEDGTGAPQPGQGAPDGAGEGESPASPPPAPAPAQPAAAGGAPAESDDQRQRDADAAQRDRMQRALERTRPSAGGEDSQGEPERPQSASEREQAQANEAWLRRVPDDPGGLLRARFRLEHERRRRAGADSTP